MACTEVVTPLLTDLYQLTMAYAYWKSGRHQLFTTFDLFYRQPPFGGSFIVFAGLEESIRFIASFRFQPDHIRYISTVIPGCHPAFLTWLQSLDCTKVRVDALREGSIAHPNVPLMKVSGPLAVVQLLETTLLNLVNYASLVATNAHRFRLAAGPETLLLEFGLRRAQGPNGALTASKYCYLGGFDATSNVAAGFKFGIPVKGTHAHSYVQSFHGIEDLIRITASIHKSDGSHVDFQPFANRVLEVRRLLGSEHCTSDGELASFIAYATAYPSSFSALVDTYSTLKSGVPNFMYVALVLSEHGFSALGVRLDSGDLAALSLRVHELFSSLASQYGAICKPATEHHLAMIKRLSIVVTNDITVDFLEDICSREHRISAFGVGTHLVTCRETPALGCVFKLSSISGVPRMKFSEEWHKSSVPGDKQVIRVREANGNFYDVLMLACERPPVIGEKCMLKTRSNPSRTVTVVPTVVESLLRPSWDGQIQSDIGDSFQYLKSARDALKTESALIPKYREENVLMSQKLFAMIDEIWQSQFTGMGPSIQKI